jgi:hypothetical protein
MLKLKLKTGDILEVSHNGSMMHMKVLRTGPMTTIFGIINLAGDRIVVKRIATTEEEVDIPDETPAEQINNPSVLERIITPKPVRPWEK